ARARMTGIQIYHHAPREKVRTVRCRACRACRRDPIYGKIRGARRCIGMKRILAATIALAGCAVDPGQPLDIHIESDPGVGPIAFSSQSSYALWTSHDATLDLGPIAGRTCFLSGVAGTIESLGIGQELRIDKQGADYQLTIVTEFPVKVWARCVPAPG